jgi:hypothetical protein
MRRRKISFSSKEEEEEIFFSLKEVGRDISFLLEGGGEGTYPSPWRRRRKRSPFEEKDISFSSLEKEKEISFSSKEEEKVKEISFYLKKEEKETVTVLERWAQIAECKEDAGRGGAAGSRGGRDHCGGSTRKEDTAVVWSLPPPPLPLEMMSGLTKTSVPGRNQ